MLAVTFDESKSIVILEPSSSLSQKDFERAKYIIDDHLVLRREIRGIIIKTKEFPCWQSFKAFLSHLNFIKNHHKRVRNIALVTDSKILNMAEHFAKHFINADIRHFGFDEFEHAQGWIFNNNDYE
jgi:stage II sporulation SpoAA-like protein